MPDAAYRNAIQAELLGKVAAARPANARAAALAEIGRLPLTDAEWEALAVLAVAAQARLIDLAGLRSLFSRPDVGGER